MNIYTVKKETVFNQDYEYKRAKEINLVFLRGKNATVKGQRIREDSDFLNCRVTGVFHIEYKEGENTVIIETGKIDCNNIKYRRMISESERQLKNGRFYIKVA